MSLTRAVFTVFISLLLLGNCAAQEYQLGWEEVNASTTAVVKDYTLDWQTVDNQIDLAQVQPEDLQAPTQLLATRPVAPQPEFRSPKQVQPQSRRYGSVWAKKDSPSYNVEFSAMRFYNTYKERYLKVQAIEVATFRKGSFTCEVFENIAEYNEYEVYLKDLKDGDRYRVRVIWDDGSNRTIETTMDSFADRNVLIDQPDCLAYTAY